MISDDVYKVVMDHAEELDSAIIYDRDFTYAYFGFKTLEVRPSLLAYIIAVIFATD